MGGEAVGTIEAMKENASLLSGLTTLKAMFTDPFFSYNIIP
jgi:hypothetical protein